jgi:hypothetical protein
LFTKRLTQGWSNAGSVTLKISAQGSRQSAFEESWLLPYGLKLQQNITEYLGWYPAHPEHFRNDRAIERATSGEVDMLRHVGTPDWIGFTVGRENARGRNTRFRRLVQSGIPRLVA